MAERIEHYPVVVVGGGVAGLNAARLLKQADIEFSLFEARERFGGRVLTVDEQGIPSADGFDLGPSWFWPRMQPAIENLVSTLSLDYFPQFSDGDVIFHRMSREAPRRFTGEPAAPESMRLRGGSYSLVSSLLGYLPENAAHTGHLLARLELQNGKVLASFLTSEGEKVVSSDHIILAVPPRLLEASVSFSPALGNEIAGKWKETPTWMAPHAKFFAVYEKPFWRENGLCGSAQSMAGPLVEIHDASTASGKAALFGFIGAPAAQRKKTGESALTRAAIDQLGKLFGDDARHPTHTLIKDWAADPLTSTEQDQPGGGQLSTEKQDWVSGKWAQFLSLAASEVSVSEPGYLAGAIAASEQVVDELILRLK